MSVEGSIPVVDHVRVLFAIKSLPEQEKLRKIGKRTSYDILETYYLSEKKLAADLSSFSLRPENFLERIYTLLGATGTTSAQLQESLRKTEALYSELSTLGR